MGLLSFFKEKKEKKQNKEFLLIVHNTVQDVLQTKKIPTFDKTSLKIYYFNLKDWAEECQRLIKNKIPLAQNIKQKEILNNETKIIYINLLDSLINRLKEYQKSTYFTKEFISNTEEFFSFINNFLENKDFPKGETEITHPKNNFFKGYNFYEQKIKELNKSFQKLEELSKFLKSDKDILNLSENLNNKIMPLNESITSILNISPSFQFIDFLPDIFKYSFKILWGIFLDKAILDFVEGKNLEISSKVQNQVQEIKKSFQETINITKQKLNFLFFKNIYPVNDSLFQKLDKSIPRGIASGAIKNGAQPILLNKAYLEKDSKLSQKEIVKILNIIENIGPNVKFIKNSQEFIFLHEITGTFSEDMQRWDVAQNKSIFFTPSLYVEKLKKILSGGLTPSDRSDSPLKECLQHFDEVWCWSFKNFNEMESKMSILARYGMLGIVFKPKDPIALAEGTYDSTYDKRENFIITKHPLKFDFKVILNIKGTLNFNYPKGRRTLKSRNKNSEIKESNITNYIIELEQLLQKEGIKYKVIGESLLKKQKALDEVLGVLGTYTPEQRIELSNILNHAKEIPANQWILKKEDTLESLSDEFKTKSFLKRIISGLSGKKNEDKRELLEKLRSTGLAGLTSKENIKLKEFVDKLRNK